MSKEKHREFMFVDMRDNNRFKRMKVPKSCDFCRKRKTKCDVADASKEGVQCSNCLKNNLNCVFSDPPPKQQKTPGPSPTKRESVDRDSLPDLSSQYRHLKTFSPRDRSDSTSSISSLSPHSYILNNEQAHQKLKELQEQLEQLTVRDDVQVSWSHYADESESPTYSPGREIQGMGFTAFGQRDLPPEELENHLHKVYFEYVHVYFPILHERTFYSGRPRPSYILRNAMMALAAQYANHPILENYLRPGQSRGYVFYERAKLALDESNDVPRLSTLQALLLMVKYQETNKQPGPNFRLWMYFSQCYRLVIELNLMTENNSSSSSSGVGAGNTEDDPYGAQLRKRALWEFFLLDRILSPTRGKPFMFDSRDIHIGHPVVYDADDESERNTTHYFIQHIKLTQLSERIIHFIRDRKRGVFAGATAHEDEEVAQLDQVLANWKNELPSHFDYKNEADSVSAPPYRQFTYARHLHFCYCITTILLHRPYMSFGEPTKHTAILSAAASDIAQIAEKLFNPNGIHAFYPPIRGVQLPIFGLTLGAQVFLTNLASEESLSSSTIRNLTAVISLIAKILDSYEQSSVYIVKRLEESFAPEILHAIWEQLRVRPMPGYPESSGSMSNPSSPKIPFPRRSLSSNVKRTTVPVAARKLSASRSTSAHTHRHTFSAPYPPPTPIQPGPSSSNDQRILPPAPMSDVIMHGQHHHPRPSHSPTSLQQYSTSSYFAGPPQSYPDSPGYSSPHARPIPEFGDLSYRPQTFLPRPDPRRNLNSQFFH